MKRLLLTVLVLLAASAAYAESVEEYLDRIESIRQTIERADENYLYAEKASRELIELSNITVSMENGEVVEVPNDWAAVLADELFGDDPTGASKKVLDKLNAVSAQIEDMKSGETASLDAELSTAEEFGDGAQKPSIDDRDLGIRRRLKKLADWLRKDMEDNKPREPGYHKKESTGIPAGLFTAAVVVIVGILLIMIGYYVAKGRGSSSPSAPKVSGLRISSMLEDALQKTPEQWKQLAREYFDGGDYTNALRALYLSLLVVMHRRRLISYDLSKTNWEYVWEINPERAESGPFKALTLAFDFKWYGREDCAREEYLKLEEMADSAVAYGEKEK